MGKTCIIGRLVSGTFKEGNPATIGAAFQTHVMSTDRGTVSMQLWDTAGQEKYRALAPMYYRSADVAVLCYDVTNIASFEAMEQWSNELADKAPPNLQLIMVGNKIDLVNERVVSKELALSCAKKHGAVFYTEVSAKTGEGITDLFMRAAQLGENTGHHIVVKETELKARAPEQRKRCC